MRLDNFIISTGTVANDGATSFVQGGHAGTVTLTTTQSIVESSGWMSAVGVTLLVGDGTSTRTISFAFSSTSDTVMNISSMSDLATWRSRLVTAINGATGGAVDITASNPGSGANITLAHDSGGKITISFGGDSTSTTSGIKGGVTYLTASPEAATSSEVEVASAFASVTGSVDHNALIESPTMTKVTLRDNNTLFHISKL